MTKQAQNNIDLCKGNSPEKILMLWNIGRLPDSIIREIATHFNISNDKQVVANYLSKL